MLTKKPKRMGFISLTPPQHHAHGPLLEEIPSLLRLYKDGHVDRLPLVPDVPSSLHHHPSVSSLDVPLDLSSHLWARLYAPLHATQPLPVLLYFHGGGFCVGSPSWKCYHDFLLKLSSRANCTICSLAYRLAPEHRLPAAFDDGHKALLWLVSPSSPAPAWWSSRCDLANLFLAGDSAGANIAIHVTSRSALPVSESIRGLVLIQPFIGGEVRTWSEENLHPAAGSALTLATADAYWRLALPAGASRDHEWCNPSVEGLRVERVMVCVAEMDILRDRAAELCRKLRAAGKKVEEVVHGDVGHAFQVVGGTRVAQRRADEMVGQIRSFIDREIGR